MGAPALGETGDGTGEAVEEVHCAIIKTSDAPKFVVSPATSLSAMDKPTRKALSAAAPASLLPHRSSLISWPFSLNVSVVEDSFSHALNSNSMRWFDTQHQTMNFSTEMMEDRILVPQARAAVASLPWYLQ